MDMQALSAITAAWPTDWILIGAVAAFIAFDAYRSGTGRAVAIVLALPVVLVLNAALSHAVYADTFVKGASPFTQAGIFIALAAILFILIRKMMGNDYGASSMPLPALLAGISAAIVIAAVWNDLESLRVVWSFGPQVKGVFGETLRFWWLLAALVGLSFARR